jgi:hypothetical protein
MKDNKYSLSEIFSTGLYNEVKEFTILKTFFKEVKVIRPLCISKTKQIDISPEYSLLQIKIENITSSINFIDKSLKLSKFLDTSSDNDLLNNGMSLVIKEIQIIKEETSIENKTVINLKNQEQTINNDNIPVNNIHFNIINNDFPIEIRPGEEVVIVIKLYKSAFIYEQMVKVHETVKNEINKLGNHTPLLTTPNTITRRDSFSSRHTLHDTVTKISKIKSPNVSSNNLTQVNFPVQNNTLAKENIEGIFC